MIDGFHFHFQKNIFIYMAWRDNWTSTEKKMEKWKPNLDDKVTSMTFTKKNIILRMLENFMQRHTSGFLLAKNSFFSIL